MRIAACLWVAAVLLFPWSVSIADDCTRDCSACLLRRFWDGGCIQHGNDPTCEAAKAACLAARRVPAILSPIPGVGITQRCLSDLSSCPEHVINELSHREVIDACLRQIKRCPQLVISSLPADAVWPVLMSYRDGLYSQASGRWRALPASFIDQFEGEYPDIDLGAVRYATNIDTGHGQAITFHYHIFFPSEVDLGSRLGLELMLHELVHTEQYERRGGERAFLSEYLFKGAGQILARRSLNVHDFIDIEQDAIAQAASLINDYGWQFYVNNTCHKPITLFLLYRDEGELKTNRYSVHEHETAFLASASRRLHSNNRQYYWYAEIPDTNIQWSGDKMIDVDGETYPFNEKLESPTAQRFEIGLSCHDVK